MSRAARWAELALQARGLALPVLFITAWVCLALLWRDPTFQRDQLWRREQLWTWLRGPLALALGVWTLIALGLYLIEPGHLFDLPRSSPWRWLLVMLLYPTLSVVPQELVFRTFFFHEAAAALAGREPAGGRSSRTAAEASWVEALLELMRAARVAASGRRTLVAHPRPAF